MIIIPYLISVLLMIILPVFLAFLLRRRFKVPWVMFCAGMVTFTVSQVVHIPLNDLLGRVGILPRAGAIDIPPYWLICVVLGLTAGLCEELARTAGYAILRKWRKFEDGMMMGLGHGGIEAMVFGGVLTAASVSSLLPYIGSDLSKLPLTVPQLEALRQQIEMITSAPWMAVLPLLERVLAIVVQVILSMIVWSAFSRRKAGGLAVSFVIIAILYHAVIDAGIVYLSAYVTNPWLLEGILGLMILPGAVWLWRIFPKKEPAKVAVISSSEFVNQRVVSLKDDWSILMTALQKEMLQQWRTKRVLVVVLIFGLFGMGSPLLAYFTPQMLKMVPGAEQFASLVPTPTAADAMAQYIKNLTQFGFILAILLGMGAVAGEKERGTTSMILSKPMTRWAFITSKLAAQVSVYLLAFFLAMLGAYFYTIVLFGDLDFGAFSLINLLLFFWLLQFVVVTLLGSVIGNSTGAAAGIGLGASILLLLLGNIPQYGMLTPNGLMAWAGQLATSVPVQAPNLGALASSVVLLVVCLVTAIGIFERQEL
jgi:ABC-2 type transport system permease protein